MPSARGLETNPLALIQHLRHNLVDRYPRDSITKELLQNAEDARASSINLGWTPGLPAACHPLLQGPALFTVNNGPFSACDAEAICQFGLNYKAADRASIGKFGLGLKSVFHLCEAFFYLSSTEPGEGEDPELFNSVVNPWFGTPHHTNWNEFSLADRNLIRLHLAPLLNGPHWFCLWLPLRRERHCPGLAPIHKDFPGDETACPPDLVNETGAVFLADQLPLLRHLRTISVWDRWNGPEAVDMPLVTASILADAFRSRFPDPLPAPIGGSGTVTLQVRGRTGNLAYALTQYWLPPLEEFRKQPGWPQSFSLGDDGQPRPEKAEPHCAISLTRRPTERPGQLTISRAVFLPLRGSTAIVPCDDLAEYSLKLHGCFFVDAGRGEPGVGATATADPSDETALKQEWNRRLLEDGICVLLVPTVAKLVAELQRSGQQGVVTGDAIRSLTASLQGSHTFQEHRTRICRGWQWAYRWRPEGFAWEQIAAKVPILEIPDPGEDGPDLPGQALPRLAELVERYAVVPAGYPRLMSGPAVPWPEKALQVVLDVPPGPLFEESSKRWIYVRKFMTAAPPQAAGPLAVAALAELLRRVFAGVRSRALRDQGDAVRSVVRLLPAGQRISIPLPANWSEGDRQAFLTERAGAVLIPTEFDPDDAPGIGRLTTDEAVRLLKTIEPHCQRLKTSGPARALLAAVEGEVPSVLVRCADLNLWQGERITPAGSAQEVFCYSRLTHALRDKVLFESSTGTVTVATFLATALAEREIVLLPPETAAVLFGKGEVPPCEAVGLFAALAEAPPLAAPECRVGLLRHLLSRVPEGPEVVAWLQAARYLLHGRAEAVQDKSPLFVNSRKDGGVWGRLARLALDASGGGWRVIPSGALADLLAELRPKALDVCDIDPDGVARLLSEIGPDKIEIDFGPPEQEQVIYGLREYPALLKGLPVHDGLDGRLHRIDDRTYWKETWYTLEGPLAQQINLLQPCRKDHLAAIQLPLALRLTPVEVLKLAATGLPGQHWKTILDALRVAGTLPSELRRTLADVEWLPLRTGAVSSPGRVLYDPELKNDVTSVLAKVSVNGDVCPSALHADLKAHKGFDDLIRHKLFPARDQLLSRLGGVLKPHELFRVGPLPFTEAEAMVEWLEAFQDAPADVMPVRDLLARVRKVDPDLCRSHFLPNLTGEMSAARLERVLAFLRELHATPTSARPVQLLRVHNAYLRAATTEAATFPTLLPRLRLLSRDGDWAEPTRLCAGVTGIDPRETLDTEQEKVLQRWIKVQKPREVKAAASRSASDENNHFVAAWYSAAGELDKYFKPWADASEELGHWAGAFLSLLGDFEPIRKLAVKYLPRGRSPEYVRASVGLRDRNRVASGDRRMTDGPAYMMKIQRFLVEVAEPKPTLQVVNLLGGTFNARAATQTKDLLIGYGIRKLDVLLEGDLQVHWLQLRPVDPVRPDPSELRRLLEGTANRLLREVYEQTDASLRDVLAELCKEEEFGIRTTQAVLLEGAGHYLRQFGLTSPPTLRDALRQYDDAADRRAEERTAAERGRNLDGETAEEKADKARRHLQQLIETNNEVGSAILAAVRRKLGDYRYHTAAVLFELFQNADDAYVELGQEGARLFAVHAEAECVTVMHAGRRINRPAGAEAEDAGHARDLRKMLALGHSDKGFGTEGDVVTGRFGLGFKSVFLICDQPAVVSGRLGFEVLGGIYPRPLGKELAEHLRQRLQTLGPVAGDGTVFELPLRKETSLDKVIGPFRDLAAYLVVFAQRIRCCRLIRTKGTIDEASWSEETIATAGDVACVTTGVLRPLWRDSDDARRVIVVRSRNGDLLLAIDPHGVVPLSAAVPTVWVTAPTQEKHNLGWAVNGRRFALDVGRSQVDWTADSNRNHIAQLGDEIGQGLLALFDAGASKSGWTTLSSRLQLAEGVTPQDFWETLWRTLSLPAGGPELLRSLLWGSLERGVSRLYAEREALPSGFTIEGRRRLTRLDKVEVVLNGILDAEGRSDLLERAAELPGLRRLDPTTLVSDRTIWSRLRVLSPHLTAQPSRMDLATLLSEEIRNRPMIDPDRAACFGRIVTPILLAEMENGPADHRDEARRLRENAFLGAQFRTRDHSWQPARRLLIPQPVEGEQTDEMLRAAFADSSRVLADDYCTSAGMTAIQFVLACRGRMEAKGNDMVDWAIQAKGEQRQLAILNYLLDGEWGARVAQELRALLHKIPWLAQLESSGLLALLSDKRRYELLGRLWMIQPSSPVPPQEPPVVLPRLDPRTTLRQIARWWETEGEQRLRQYEEDIYPDGRMPVLSPEPPERNLDARKRWLTLFLAGMLLTLGRSTRWRPQNRAFMKMCQTRGWLDLLADPGAGSAKWLHAVESYIDRNEDRIPYFHWLRQFIGIATVARHLDAYIDCFLTPNNITDRFSLRDLLTPRTNPYLQGTGVDAPPLGPILGIGAHFVLRELVRSGVIVNRRVWRYCYPPVQRLLDFLKTRLGWQNNNLRTSGRSASSQLVYEFLRDHSSDQTFVSAFDLPLLILAEDDQLQASVLHNVLPVSGG
jgi:hypothetical protein